MDGDDVVEQVGRAARKTGQNPVVEHVARLGYVGTGILHLLLGWIGVQVAIGHTADSADQSGALGLLAESPWGKALLVVTAVGCAVLALYQLTKVFARGIADDGPLGRGKSAATCLVYAAFGYSALRFALGKHSSSKQQSTDMTAQLMSSLWGRLVVGLIALVLLGIGGYHVVKGWTRKFVRADLEENPGTWVVVVGWIGYVAKGLALIAVGVLFALAAIKRTTADAGGLDTALRRLRDLPFGSALLIAVSLGLAAYGIYSFARARYTRG